MEYHKPVLLDECLAYLQPKSGGVYFDGTLGGGGHSEAILRACAPDGILVATDKDEDAIAFASERLREFKRRFYPIRADFADACDVLDKLGFEKLDGAILDLGVSSFQLDNFDRGFSYRAEDSRLDMRMDNRQEFSAYNVVNEYDEKRLKDILFAYGEEKFTNRIVANILKRRADKPIETTGELVQIIYDSIPAAARREGGHPAKRTFQAIRIEVNGEIEILENAVRDLAMRLRKGGRLCVITFHSLEDRIVKNVFKELETDCICDKSLPVCVCGKKSEGKVLTKHPVTASESELLENNRSKPAKLRVFEKK